MGAGCIPVYFTAAVCVFYAARMFYCNIIIRVAENGTDKATVILNGNAPSIVYFTKENDMWRICGADFGAFVFSGAGNASDGELSADIASDLINSAVYEIYFYTRIDASKLDIQKMCGDTPIEVKDIVYLPANSGFDTKDKWQAYVKSFCTDDVADRLLLFGNKIVQSNGVIYYNGDFSATSVRALFTAPDNISQLCKVL